jgi:hypothetical protein
MNWFSSKDDELEQLVTKAEAADARARGALREQFDGAGRGEFVPGYREALREAADARRDAQELYDELRRER